MFFVFVFVLFWLRRAACGILVPGPGIIPTPPEVEAWSLSHWTSREVPGAGNLIIHVILVVPRHPNVRTRKV